MLDSSLQVATIYCILGTIGFNFIVDIDMLRIFTLYIVCFFLGESIGMDVVIPTFTNGDVSIIGGRYTGKQHKLSDITELLKIAKKDEAFSSINDITIDYNDELFAAYRNVILAECCNDFFLLSSFLMNCPSAYQKIVRFSGKEVESHILSIAGKYLTFLCYNTDTDKFVDGMYCSDEALKQELIKISILIDCDDIPDSSLFSWAVKQAFLYPDFE